MTEKTEKEKERLFIQIGSLLEWDYRDLEEINLEI